MRAYILAVTIAVASWLAIARVSAATDSSGGGGGRQAGGHTSSVAVSQKPLSRAGATRTPAKAGRASNRPRVIRPLLASTLFWPEDANSADDSGTGTPAPLLSPANAPPESSSIQPLQPLKPAQPLPSLPSGNLRLDVNPRTAQVYVDGFFAGSAADSSLAGLMLASGWHRIQLRAPGYETLAINVTVRADRTTDSRSDLKPIRQVSAGRNPQRDMEAGLGSGAGAPGVGVTVRARGVGSAK
jgi:PEGA domain-containing protein